MTNPVAPKEGHYARLMNGEVVGPIKKYETFPGYAFVFTAHLPHMSWNKNGISDWNDRQYDIIATISPADMQAVANGELERLRAALVKIENMEYINQLSGQMNFERAPKIARAALERGTV